MSEEHGPGAQDRPRSAVENFLVHAELDAVWPVNTLGDLHAFSAPYTTVSSGRLIFIDRIPSRKYLITQFTRSTLIKFVLPAM